MVKLDLGKVDIDQDARSPIPAGTIVPLRMKLLPGDVAPDKVFVRSAKGDCFGLKARYTVTEGDYAGRSFQLWHLVDGATEGHKEARNYTLLRLRHIVDAVRGLNPKDNSAEANSARLVDITTFFNGAVFLAEVGVEKGGAKTRGGGNFKDKNVIARVLMPGHDDYRQLDQTPAPVEPTSRSSNNGAGQHNGASMSGAPDGNNQPGSAIAKPKWVT